MDQLQILGIPQSTYTRIVRMVAHEKGGLTISSSRRRIRPT